MVSEPVISIWGPVGAGKTVYLASLILALSNSSNEKWRIWPQDEGSASFINSTVSYLANGQFAPPTDHPYGLNLRIFRQDSFLGDHTITIWDTMGGMFESGQEYRRGVLGGDGDYLFERSHSILLMIDPTRVYRGEIGNDLNEKFIEFLNALSKYQLTKSGYLDISLAVCLTKMDQFWERRNSPKEFLESLLGANSLSLITNVCHPKRLSFFSTSVVGCHQTSDNPHKPNFDSDRFCIVDLSAWKPYGILEPFIWSLEDIENRKFADLPSWQRAFHRVFNRKQYARFATRFPSQIPSISSSVNKTETANSVNPASIFISYSRKDWEQFVQPLVERLKKDGFEVWLDQHLIEGGDDWLDSINEALKICERMVLCISPDSMASKYVRMEYRYFLDNNKRFVPLMCINTTLPAELIRINHLDYSNYNGLLSSLRKTK